jgi:hypothetical protein
MMGTHALGQSADDPIGSDTSTRQVMTSWRDDEGFVAV